MPTIGKRWASDNSNQLAAGERPRNIVRRRLETAGSMALIWISALNGAQVFCNSNQPRGRWGSYAVS